MRKIELKNYKQEIRITIAIFIIAAVLVYWGISGKAPFRMFGLEPGSFLSMALLFLLAIIVGVPGINMLVKRISVLNYSGGYAIHMNNESITYPETQRLKGFTPVTQYPRRKSRKPNLKKEEKTTANNYRHDPKPTTRFT